MASRGILLAGTFPLESAVENQIFAELLRQKCSNQRRNNSGISLIASGFLELVRPASHARTAQSLETTVTALAARLDAGDNC